MISFRNYKREAELARMSWKIKPQDLLPTHLGARGQFGSRYSLGKLSLPVMKMNELHELNFNFLFFSRALDPWRAWDAQRARNKSLSKLQCTRYFKKV